MKIEFARPLAESLIWQMKPYVERAEIAGSIRRGAKEVKDIEIVAIPKWEECKAMVGLFHEERTYHINKLHSWATNDAKINWIKPGTEEVIPWKIQPSGKYWRGMLPLSGLKVDLFLCTPENWGVIFLIRTGSADFSAAMMAFAKRHNKSFKDGRLHIGKLPIETPEEEDVFRLLHLDYVPPEKRTGRHVVKPEKLTKTTPRLSVDLPFERRPDMCQACGVVGAIHVNEGVKDEVTHLTRWREHDENDKPESIIVVLCKECGDKLIEPHPRLYDYLQVYEPHIGSMSVCIDCRHRWELCCMHPERKAAGGPGVKLEMPQPTMAHLYYGGMRGEWLRTWRGPVKCNSREEVEPTAVWNGDNDSPGEVRQAQKES